MVMARKEPKYVCEPCHEDFKGTVRLAKHFKENPGHRSMKQQRKFLSNQRDKSIAQRRNKTKRRKGHYSKTRSLPTIRKATRTKTTRITERFCTQCGAGRKPLYRFCGGCGEKL
jgi:hypothetical protein